MSFPSSEHPDHDSPAGHAHSGEHGDETVGRVMGRREALRLFAASPFLLATAGCTSGDADASGPVTGSCIARPELTEGPFYVDTGLIRSDLREDREGEKLELSFTVSRAEGNSCGPLEGALVDVWHADAKGSYSGTGPHEDETFLRGTQRTDGAGVASFTTIYPGWYPGRTPHVHFKVRFPADARSPMGVHSSTEVHSPAEETRAYEFTSQLFFEDALSRRIYTNVPPYAKRGAHDTTNDDDWIYGDGGPRALLAVSETDQGREATFDLALHVGQ